MWYLDEFMALLIKNMNSPPTPNSPGRNIFKSPPKLGDERGLWLDSNNKFIFQFSNAKFLIVLFAYINIFFQF